MLPQCSEFQSLNSGMVILYATKPNLNSLPLAHLMSSTWDSGFIMIISGLMSVSFSSATRKSDWNMISNGTRLLTLVQNMTASHAQDLQQMPHSMFQTCWRDLYINIFVMIAFHFISYSRRRPSETTPFPNKNSQACHERILCWRSKLQTFSSTYYRWFQTATLNTGLKSFI